MEQVDLGCMFVELFDVAQHGDKEHREWLRDVIIEFAKKYGCAAIDESCFTVREKDAV